MTLDPDVAALIKRAMQQRSVGFKQAVNDGLRAGLGGPVRVDLSFPAFDLGLPSVDLTSANRVADALHDEGLAHRLAEGR